MRIREIREIREIEIGKIRDKKIIEEVGGIKKSLKHGKINKTWCFKILSKKNPIKSSYL